eukprot:630287-Rhodomonas_salina.5
MALAPLSDGEGQAMRLFEGEGPEPGAPMKDKIAVRRVVIDVDEVCPLTCLALVRDLASEPARLSTWLLFSSVVSTVLSSCVHSDASPSFRRM